MSYDQFCACVAGYSNTSAGGTVPVPSQQVYNDFIKYGASGLSLTEQAMFLSNAIWETGGLQFLSEVSCSSGSCSYGNYYGRGYLQLTWQENYQKASTAIFNSDTLVSDPNQVANSDVGWQTAQWFWNTIVHPQISPQTLSSLDLGVSVKQINGPVECTSPCQSASTNRLKIFNTCLAALNISGTGTLSSCC
jgi:hypothetical protein